MFLKGISPRESEYYLMIGVRTYSVFKNWMENEIKPFKVGKRITFFRSLLFEFLEDF